MRFGGERDLFSSLLYPQCLKNSWMTEGAEEPDGLLSIVSQSVRHDRSDLACIHAHIHIQLLNE